MKFTFFIIYNNIENIKQTLNHNLKIIDIISKKYINIHNIEILLYNRFNDQQLYSYITNNSFNTKLNFINYINVSIDELIDIQNLSIICYLDDNILLQTSYVNFIINNFNNNYNTIILTNISNNYNNLCINSNNYKLLRNNIINYDSLIQKTKELNINFIIYNNYIKNINNITYNNYIDVFNIIINNFINNNLSKNHICEDEFIKNCNSKYIIDNNVYSDDFFIKIKELYHKNKYNNIQKIPKIIHQVWLGSELPLRYKRLVDTWKKYNPDWEYILWTESKIKKLNLVNKDIYDKTTTYSPKSDILRYELLYKFGGLYVDTDFECLKSLNDLICNDFVIGFTETKHWYKETRHNFELNCAFSMSIPKHKLVHDMLFNIKNFNDKNSIDLMNSCGPNYALKHIKNNIYNNVDNIMIYPSKYFYSVTFDDCYNRVAGFNDNDIEKVKHKISNLSYAIHWYHGSWLKDCTDINLNNTVIY